MARSLDPNLATIGKLTFLNQITSKSPWTLSKVINARRTTAKYFLCDVKQRRETLLHDRRPVAHNNEDKNTNHSKSPTNNVVFSDERPRRANCTSLVEKASKTAAERWPALSLSLFLERLFLWRDQELVVLYEVTPASKASTTPNTASARNSWCSTVFHNDKVLCWRPTAVACSTSTPPKVRWLSKQKNSTRPLYAQHLLLWLWKVKKKSLKPIKVTAAT